MRKFKKVPRCFKTKKAKFPTEKLASKAMFRIWSHDTKANIYDLHTYVCPHCEAWHVGHKSYYAKELEKKNSQAEMFI